MAADKMAYEAAQQFCILSEEDGLFKTSCGQSFDTEPILCGMPADYTPFCLYCYRPIYQKDLQ